MEKLKWLSYLIYFNKAILPCTVNTAKSKSIAGAVLSRLPYPQMLQSRVGLLLLLEIKIYMIQ